MEALATCATGSPKATLSVRSDCILDAQKKNLMSGRIFLWCNLSRAEKKKVELYMTVTCGPDQHFCTLFRDANRKYTLGYFNLKNCEVLRSTRDQTRFEVRLHTSERSGLYFETPTKEEVEKWVKALYPRIITNSPAVSLSRAFCRVRIDSDSHEA